MSYNHQRMQVEEAQFHNAEAVAQAWCICQHTDHHSHFQAEAAVSGGIT